MFLGRSPPNETKQWKSTIHSIPIINIKRVVFNSFFHPHHIVYNKNNLISVENDCYSVILKYLSLSRTERPTTANEACV